MCPFDNPPNILLFGSDTYRGYPKIPASDRSLDLLRKALSRISGKDRYHETIGGRFSRPQSLFEDFGSIQGESFTFAYYFGHLMKRRDGGVYFAHPASNPQRTSSHIKASDLVDLHCPTRQRKLLFVIDSEVRSPGSISVDCPENVLFVFRRLKHSKRTWRNGGELLTGCFAETAVDMHRALPTVTFRELLTVVAYRLGHGHASDCFLYCGDETVLEKSVFSNSRESGLWFSDRDRLE